MNVTMKCNQCGFLSAMFLALVWSLNPRLCCADEIRAQLAIGEEPYFVGLPVPLKITVSGVEQTPAPTWQLANDLPDGVTLTLVDVSPQTSSRTIITNGRTVVNESETKFALTFQLISGRSGSVPIGTITIKQNGNQTSVSVPAFRFTDISVDDEMEIGVELPPGPLYVGQRAPVSIVWAYSGDISRVRNLRFSSPFFDNFKFVDEDVARNDTYASFTSNSGEVNVRASRSQENRSGKQFELLTFRRTVLATEPGKFEHDAVVADIDYVTRFRRSIFGSSRRAAAMEPRRGKSSPFTIDVLPLPGNPPASFAGAIGTGFRLVVDVVGSTIVNVGDPIKLKLTVTGNGNINEIGLPALTGESAFDSKLFRAPSEPLAGTVNGNSKEFVAQVRVINAEVGQIPPIAYSWFDPSVGEYKTAKSEPRSISVGGAKRISSADVVSAAPAPTATQANSAGTKTGSVNDQASGVSDIDLSSVDLSINIQTEELAEPASKANKMIPIACYAVGLAALVVSAAARVRRSSAKGKSDQQEQLRSAANAVTKAARERDVRSLVTALRGLLPHTDSTLRSNVEELLAELETQIYAPTAEGGHLDEMLINRAIEISSSAI